MGKGKALRDIARKLSEPEVVYRRPAREQNARDAAAELYPLDGTDPGVVTALRKAFLAGADWAGFHR